MLVVIVSALVKVVLEVMKAPLLLLLLLLVDCEHWAATYCLPSVLSCIASELVQSLSHEKVVLTSGKRGWCSSIILWLRDDVENNRRTQISSDADDDEVEEQSSLFSR